VHRQRSSFTPAARQPRRLRQTVLALGAGLLLLACAATSPAGAAAGSTQPAAGTASGASTTAELLRNTQLRTRPDGPVVKTLGRSTDFGSPRVLAVVARRGDWLGVLSESMPAGRAGWIPAANAKLGHVRYAIEVDRSDRMLTVRRDGQVVRRFAIAVGRAGLITPTGRYAVTDALLMTRGGAYGCCVMPITGIQKALGQTRLAIHGTNAEGTIGSAASSGCVRARTADMRWLVNHVTAGTVLRIEA
jgi:lipoprotein-anchoring transpeptidase ErfK/SrfK